MFANKAKWISPTQDVSDVSNSNASADVNRKADLQPHPYEAIAPLGARGGFNQRGVNSPSGNTRTPIASPLRDVSYPTVSPGDSIEG